MNAIDSSDHTQNISQRVNRKYPGRKATTGIGILLMLFTTSTSAVHDSAQKYKCQDSQGHISYTDQPCAAEQVTLDEIYEPENEQTPEELPFSIVSKEDISGRWIDKPGPGFQSSWFFNGDRVTFATKQGITMVEGYTIEGDQLIFHHKAGLWGDSDWDESVTIVKYTGRSLVLRWGVAVVTLYRPV